MIYHNLLRVKTAAEYQHTRTEYKLLIRDRIQVEADKMSAPTWHILAFEKCATHCDNEHYPGLLGSLTFSGIPATVVHDLRPLRCCTRMWTLLLPSSLLSKPPEASKSSIFAGRVGKSVEQIVLEPN